MIIFKPIQQNIEFFNIVKPLGASINISSGENVKADVVDILPSGGTVLRIKDSYITVKTEIPLTKGSQLLLKVLDVNDNRLRLQILDILTKNEGQIKDILKTVKSDLQLMVQSFDKLPVQIQKEVISSLENQFKNSPVDFSTYKSIANIESITPESIENIVKNSGIFFENKLLHLSQIHENLNKIIYDLPVENDIRDSINKVVKEINIQNFKEKIVKLLDMVNNIEDKLIKNEITKLSDTYQSILEDLKLIENIQPHIELSQEISLLTNSLYGFLPLRWENLKFSDFKYFKNITDSQKSYHFVVNLDFEDGALSFVTTLKNDRIYITFFVENQYLKKSMIDKKMELFENLKNSGLNIEYIEILPYSKFNVEKDV